VCMLPVASRVGANPELVVPTLTGLLFEPGDAEGLAVQLRTLVVNEDLPRQHVEASAKRVARDLMRRGKPNGRHL
jgi:glycosyltransferase involved in cell wall biosynthesis